MWQVEANREVSLEKKCDQKGWQREPKDEEAVGDTHLLSPLLSAGGEVIVRL